MENCKPFTTIQKRPTKARYSEGESVSIIGRLGFILQAVRALQYVGAYAYF